MYYKNIGADERQEQFFVETELEMTNLPTATTEGDIASASGEAYRKVGFGSIAIVVATGNMYVLTSNNQWTKVGG